MADSDNPKKNVNWQIETLALERLDQLAQKDRRTVGAEVAFLIDKEYAARELEKYLSSIKKAASPA